MWSALQRILCGDVWLMETGTTMQKAIPGWEEEEADGERKGPTVGRAQGFGERGEARTLHGADFFISTTWNHARAFHNLGAHGVSSPLPLLLSLFSSLQTQKEET